MSQDAAKVMGHRVLSAARERQVDPQRMRRGVVFQRILARLSRGDGWTLKGGFCLEVRLGSARATKDLDLALDGASMAPADLQDRLDEALEVELDDDFSFQVGLPTLLTPGALGNDAFRCSVVALIGGARFETVKVDVVCRVDEIDGGTEDLVVPSPLSVRGHDAATVRAVDVHQHAAEKIHAYCRVYSGDRPSTRVKDLVDLVLLEEAGLIVPAELADRLTHVFRVRDSTTPPATVPAPPTSWAVSYAALAAEIGMAAADLPAATRLLVDLYDRVSATTERRTS